MEQLANSIAAAKRFDDVTAIMRAELGDDEIDSRVGPWDPNSATFSVDQWERDYQTYNALIETMRDRGTYTPSPIILQVARHAATLYVAKDPGKPLGVGHREFWSSPGISTTSISPIMSPCASVPSIWKTTREP